MSKKSKILKNLRDYSPEEIASAIKAGKVSMYELSKSGNLTPLMRRKIEFALNVTPISTKQETIVPGPETENENETVSKEGDSLDYGNFPSVISLNGDFHDDNSINMMSGSSPANRISPPEKKKMFCKPFSFKGRIRRTEYWLSLFIYNIFNVFLTVSAVMVGQSTQYVPLFALAIILIIPAIWFMWSQGARRCHDLGHSGWFQLIPFYGLWMLFADSKVGDNKYGNYPKN